MTLLLPISGLSVGMWCYVGYCRQSRRWADWRLAIQ